MLPKISLPVQLLLVIAFVIIFGHSLPFHIIQYFYSISIVLKECLNFFLPMMVFSFICTGILSFKQKTPLVIAVMIGLVFISNIVTPLIAYFSSTLLLSYITNNTDLCTLSIASETAPIFLFALPPIIKPEYAIFLGVSIGTLVSYFSITKAESVLLKSKKIIEWVIKKLFIPLLPLYVFGFLIEVHHRGIFFDLCQSYGKTYALIILLQYLLVFIFFWIAAGFNLKKTIVSVKIALPSYITAFGTMSGAATIPVTIECAEQNTHNKPLAEITTPILTNIHMLGDAVTVVILSVVTLFLFQGTIPPFATFLTFILYYSTTMLGASGIPGGGITVTAPILRSILGCSDGMISIMITLHLLQDGFGTGANVMADGGLIIMIHKVLNKLKSKMH